MSSSSHPMILPVVTLQPTAGEVIDEVERGIIPSDKIWVSCYKTGQPSIHTKVNVELDERDRNSVRTISEDSSVVFNSNHAGGRRFQSYTVSALNLGVSNARLFAPRQEYVDADTSNIRSPKRIEAFDISPDGSRFAAGFLDGSVMVYPTSRVKKEAFFTPEKVESSSGSKLFARPHASGVTNVRFFPSSKVLLTAGLDFALSILPADLPETPSASTAKTVEAVRVLRGHKRAVTSIGILGVGRNILSSSLDCTVKLWDVPSGTEIGSMPTTSAIISTSLGEKDALGEPSGDDRDVPEVQQTVVFAGLQDGTFEVFDLSSKKSTFRSKSPAQPQQLTSIAYSRSNHTVATGSNTGIVNLYDVRSLSTPLSTFVRQDGEILDLAAFATGPSNALALAVATRDGLPFVARVEADGTVHVDELVGVDCDPVRQIRVRDGGSEGEEEIWLSSDDSIVRRYIYRS